MWKWKLLQILPSATVVDVNEISGRDKNVHWMNEVDDDKLFSIITKSSSLLP